MPDLKKFHLQKQNMDYFSKYLQINVSVDGLKNITLNTLIFDLCFMLHSVDNDCMLIGVWLENYDLQFYTNVMVADIPPQVDQNAHVRIRYRSSHNRRVKYCGSNLMIPVIFNKAEICDLTKLKDCYLMFPHFKLQKRYKTAEFTKLNLYLKSDCKLAQIKQKLIGLKPY